MVRPVVPLTEGHNPSALYFYILMFANFRFLGHMEEYIFHKCFFSRGLIWSLLICFTRQAFVVGQYTF